MTYRIREDGAVLDAAGGYLGRVALLTRGGNWRQGMRWCAVDRYDNLLAGPTRLRDLAALRVIREVHPDAQLLDLVVTT